MLLQAMAGEALYCYDGALRMATMSRQDRRRMIKNNNVGRSQERRIHRNRRFAVVASTAGSDLKEVESIISVETPTLTPSSPPPQQESSTTLLQSTGEALKGKSIATVKGTVVLMKKTVLGIDLTDVGANLIDDIYEIIGRRISFQLVSATVGDPNNGNRGMVGKVADLKGWSSSDFSLAANDCNFDVTFKWDEEWGVPGAVIVNNYHPNEFYLKTLTLENVPGKGRVQFVCNSWVYPEEKYKYNRVFFSNDTYLPCDTPLPLEAYREDELIHLRGDDVTRQLETHDRIYRYDYYNDLGKPDKDPKFSRRVLGGSQDYPYPRRARTGRPPTKTEPESESRLPLVLSLGIYVPRDEKFGPVKLADFIGYTIKSVVQGVGPGLVGLLFRKQYKSFKEVLSLYEGGLPIPDISGDDIPFELIKELLRTDGENLPKLPVPQVIQADDSIWRTDEEFGREMVAGVDPVIIRRLEEFPPTSNLDPKIYGDHCSRITAEDIEKNLNGLTVDQALENNKLFILDHYDTLMPYLNRINSIPGTKIYASRTILYLKNDGTLKPVAIELGLPNPNGEQYGAISKVYTPADYGVENAIWQLAKAYVAVNDSGVHQLLSHWLNTHAVIEPFIIATNRQLSVVHPIHKLMKPHYHDTTFINALARGVLINADGVLEKTVFPGKYALEMSAVVYKNWKLTEQGLPDDLLKRGVAVEDPTCPYNLRLLIEDYPFAVDGLAIWSAIDTWVTEYCSIYYPNDAAIVADTELQAWWKEVREVGHGDKKDETWWPKMCTVAELTKTCTTIIWIGSALHAAVNFGQYPYAGYLPNRPTLSRVFMPEPGSPEFEELKTNPDKVYLNTITGQFQAVLGVTLIEILSRHSSDELYLGQRDSPEWTSDQRALQAFSKFRETLVGIEKRIVEMNQDPSYKNRTGPVQVPYTLLYPNASHVDGESGLTGRGVPNSVSI